MNNLMFEISEKYQNFTSCFGCSPKFLYLGDSAYKAFLTTMKTETNQPENKPFMGMKVFHIINDKSHVECG